MRLGPALLIAIALAAPAQAATTMESVFQDDDLTLHSPGATVDATMAELRVLGVDRVRLAAIWDDIAPAAEPADATDPRQYTGTGMEKLDRAISSAYSSGLSVLLNARGGAPDWAQPPRPASIADENAYYPSAAKFGAFTRMLGRRYDGTFVNEKGVILPRVDAWSIWNEPNWGGLLQPQSVKGKPVAPRLYRGLYRAGAAALQATGHGRDVILLGETAPLGMGKTGITRPIYAGRFYRELFCLNRRLRPKRGCGDFSKRGPLPATGVAHHPYPVLARPEFRSIHRDEIRLADGRRLRRILDAARRHRRLAGKLPIWYTEFGYQTKPPDPYRGVSLRRQAAWNIRAERIAARDKRVLAFTQFLLRDSGPQTKYPASDRRYWSTYQTGLQFADGAAKPAYDAYRLPFMRLKSGRHWGLVRPAKHTPQPIEIQRRSGGAWGTVATPTVKGYFTVDLPRGTYRFVWRGLASRPAVSR